jgi:hypothetical protein
MAASGAQSSPRHHTGHNSLSGGGTRWLRLPRVGVPVPAFLPLDLLSFILVSHEVSPVQSSLRESQSEPTSDSR